MATSANPVAKSKEKSAPKPAVKVAPATRAKPAPSAKVSAEPFMRFYHSHGLREKTTAILVALEENPEHKGHGDLVADLVAELTEAGMDYYYLRALKIAQVGFVVEQSARLGMSGAVKLISSVSRKFIVRMDNAQLMAIAQHIRNLAR